MDGFVRQKREGNFFRDLYMEAVSPQDIRRVPCTVGELEKEGLSRGDIASYFSLVRQLYGALYLENKCLIDAREHDGVAVALWKEIRAFCKKHLLIREFPNDEPPRCTEKLPTELNLFEFVYTDKRCREEIYLVSYDEFRLTVERCLVDFPYGWYLSLRYDAYIYFPIETGGKGVLRKKESILSEKEVTTLHQKIQQDIVECEKRIILHGENPPVYPATEEKRYEWKRKCQEWFKRGIALQNEIEALSECGDIVSDVVMAGTHKGVGTEVQDDTLYVHKGQMRCQRNNHHIEQAVAVLMTTLGRDIELNVSHCLECGKFFIHYDLYKRYRERYGCILGNIRMAKNGEFQSTGSELAEESSLRLCGYSVSQKDGLSRYDRQCIIAYCIDSGGMRQTEVIRLLQWFIEVNGKKVGNEKAYEKWCEDLDFAYAHGTDREQKYRIGKVEPYRRNRFICGKKRGGYS